jgi:hypothetical protein
VCRHVHEGPCIPAQGAWLLSMNMNMNMGVMRPCTLTLDKAEHRFFT